MKKLLSFLVVVSVLFVAGCQSDKFPTLRPVTSTNHVPEISVTNTVYLTNTVEIPAVVDSTGAVVQPPREVETVQPVLRVTTVPAHTEIVTNGWEKDPRVYETANSIGALFPGWGTLGAGLFGALGSIAAAWKTAAARKANNRADATEAGLVGTIDGIEQIRLALQQTEKGRELDAKVVEALKTAQANAGAVDLVQKLIEIHTGYTKQQVDLSKILADPKA